LQRSLLMKRFFFALGFSFLLSGFLFSQDRKKKLQAENKKLRIEIVQLNTRLSRNKKTTETLIDDINLLQQKIQAREKIIQNIIQEKNIVQNAIEEKEIRLKQLQDEVSRLKTQYRHVLLNAYKRRHETNSLLFILSAKGFSEMYRRYQYLKTYGKYRKKQVFEINSKEDSIQKQVLELKAEKADKERLLASQKAEKSKIDAERQEQKEALIKLEANKGIIVKQIRKKEAQARKIQSQIKAIIKEEIRIAKEKAAKEARLAKEKAKKNAKTKREISTQGKRNTTPSLTKEARILSSNFSANKGKLPLPVANGKITQGFGKQAYKGLKNIYINNDGVDIETTKGTAARAVFKGIVSAIISIPGGNKAVLVQHGNYFSVYNNLSKIYVSKRQSVKIKQPLGEIYTDSATGKTILNFQIWKNSVKQNPAYWIYN